MSVSSRLHYPFPRDSGCVTFLIERWQARVAALQAAPAARPAFETHQLCLLEVLPSTKENECYISAILWRFLITRSNARDYLHHSSTPTVSSPLPHNHTANMADTLAGARLGLS
jgi:hypothetical protein